MPYNANENEQEVLKYWDERKCFEKSIASRPEDKPYVFYDGPPFATGLPHYGHILSSVIKDVVPRYWTMKGYRVRRRWGWDCHGLPIESIIEKELGTSGKKDIEKKVGVAGFNEACRSKVLIYTQEWKKMINRIGRWIEFDDSYKTMDPTYMESVWWALKTIWDKGLVYEGNKVLMYCPRCETPISKAETAMDNSYKDIEDFSTVFKFKVVGEDDTYILAWSTTPWNKLVTIALAVHKDLEYVKVEEGGEKYILAKDRLEILKTKDYKILEEIKGKKLIGMDYEPSYDFDYDKQGKKAHYVVGADFVGDDEGTGVVTIAPYGEEDIEVMKENDLPMVLHLDSTGHLTDVIPPWKGMYYRDADPLIVEDLEKRGLIYWTEKEKHNYPFCWRCDTQLYYNPINAWFINIQKVKKRLIKLNEKINWYPEHLKHGRFLNILETAPDWNISRNRYWATPLPFWKCEKEDCDQVECIGSVKELKEKAVNFDEVYSTDKVEEMDLHKHLADQIKLKCDKCDSEMSRTPEVIDCWVESGSMPFAEFHYPFENEEVFKKRYPGQYIAEYIAQTRAWFYYMHVMAILLFDDIGFENCVTTGTILNDKGEKLSKSKMNYTDPWEIIEQYGVDALRYYLMSGVVMQAENLFFNDRDVRDAYNKVVNLLHNVLSFYLMYAEEKPSQDPADSPNVLDKWILSRLNQLVAEVTTQMDNYNTVKATRPIKDFIDQLSTWYVRRSRDRFKGEDEQDRQFALATLNEVLITLSKVMAPFTPFIAEKIYLALDNSKESVHLEDWPEADSKMVDEKLLNNMERVRKIVEMGLALRAENGIRVRQPLSGLMVDSKDLSDELLSIVASELNVKEVSLGQKPEGKDWVEKEDGQLKVFLNTTITEELKKEGLAREIVRTINQIRKEQKMTIEDTAVVEYSTEDSLLKSVFIDFADDIKKNVLASELKEGKKGEEKEVGSAKVKLSVEK